MKDIPPKNVRSSVNTLFMKTNNLLADFFHMFTVALYQINQFYCMNVYDAQLWCFNCFNAHRSADRLYVACRK